MIDKNLAKKSGSADSLKSEGSINITLCRNLLKENKNDDGDNAANCSDEWSRRYSIQAFNILNQLRCNAKLCDSKLIVDDGTEFPIHRAIMSASSRYFLALFTNGMNDTWNQSIHIKDVESDIMKHLIEWCYTRKINVTKHETVEKLLIAADKYEVIGLLNACAEHLQKNMNCENVIGINKFARVYYIESLRMVTNDFIMSNFPSIAERSKELLELDLDEFIKVLSSDELNVKKEEIVFDAIVKWIDVNPAERNQHIAKLLQCIRSGFLPKDYFIRNIKTHPYLKDRNDCKLFIIDSLKYLCEFELTENKGYSRLTCPKISKPRIPYEALFVFGGWSTKSPTNAIEVYDSALNRWYKVENPDPMPRAYHGFAAVDNLIYVIGGFDGIEYFNSCKTFEPKTKNWTEIAPMHVKRCYVSVTEYNKSIYAFGGFDGYMRHNTVEKYNIEKNQWTFVAPMNCTRSDACATTYDDLIYICGGFNGAECLNSMEYYNPLTNQWTLLSQMSERRSGLRITGHKNFIYVFGGYNGVTRLMSCEKFNIKTGQWSEIKTMSTLRSNFAVEVLDGLIYAIGGFNGAYTIDEVECYVPEQDEWYKVAEMNVNRSALNACVVKGIKNVKNYFKV